MLVVTVGASVEPYVRFTRAPNDVAGLLDESCSDAGAAARDQAEALDSLPGRTRAQT